MNLQELIAAERAKIESWPLAQLDVVLHGKKMPVTIARLLPDAWAELVAAHPPRDSTSDEPVGYNQDTLAKAYPVEHLTVAGEAVDAETWADLLSVLGRTHRANIINTIWGQNVYPAIKEKLDLGKATAGKRPASPGRKESRPDGGSAGSQAK